MTDMLRWIATLTTIVLLGGCFYTQEVVYRERYDPAPSYQGGYDDGGTYYRDGNSYYAPGYGSYGDYYSGASYYGRGSSYGVGFGVSYFDYPFYYSVFSPINRSYYDPFVYPGYYYGVTWFPRSYLSLSYHGGWRGQGWLSYSPYRGAWVDSYYDWRPWYDRYPAYRNYYPTPRYGDARVEASRLAELRRPALPRTGQAGYYRDGSYRQSARVDSGAATPAYRGNRAVDYGRAGLPQRQSSTQDDVRRVNAGTPRVAPRTGVYGNPTRAGTDTSRPGLPRSTAPRSESTPRTDGNEIRRLSGQRTLPVREQNYTPTNVERERADGRGYSIPESRQVPRPGVNSEAIPTRRLEAPGLPRRVANPSTTPVPSREVSPYRAAPRTDMPARANVERYQTAPRSEPIAPPMNRGYSTGTTIQAPPSVSMPRANPAPVRESAPVRSYPVSPASESSSEDRDASSSSRNTEVRRVGSNRNR